MPRRVKDYRGLADVSRVRLLGAVQERPGVALKALAEAVGLHVNTAREHLKILVEEGFIAEVAAPTGGRGRPPMVYRAVDDPVMNAEARRRIDRARVNGEVLRNLPGCGGTCPSGIDGLGASAAAQFDTLYEHLDDAGLEPNVDGEAMAVSLVPCPHYRMVGEDRKVACAIHTRLLRDILAQVPGPLELGELRPFATAKSCTIVLRERDAVGAVGAVASEARRA